MKKHPISILIVKCLHQVPLNEAEQKTLDNWLKQSAEKQNLFDILTKEVSIKTDLVDYSPSKQQVWERIVEMTPELAEVTQPGSFWRKLAVAACVLLVIATSVWFGWNHFSKNSRELFVKNFTDSVVKQVTLQLSDGRVILLDSIPVNYTVVDRNLKIEKKANGVSVYNQLSTIGNNHLFQTLSLPIGQIYQVILPDGTKVWLNSCSAVKVPLNFENNRNIELTGEAFFEVATLHDRSGTGKKIPFTVSAHNTTIEVLGTHFNVNAYRDEDTVRTTLVEGSVKIIPAKSSTQFKRSSFIIKPGQQATTSKEGRVAITYPDLEDIVSWKDTTANFEKAPIQKVMRLVSRWFEVEVIYEGKVTKEKFNLFGQPKTTLTEFLHVLELTEKVRFRVEGKKVYVMSRS